MNTLNIENITLKKHFFFDVDNTLTRSKSPILPEHADILRTLSTHADIVIVSGSKQEDIVGRFEKVAPIPFFILAQNGNFALAPNGEQLWERQLSDAQKIAIYAFIEKARAHTHPSVSDEDDLVEDRGCQIAFSFIGHHEKVDIKEQFDPTFAVRKKVLADLEKDVLHLANDFDVEISIGGTTNLDIYLKGKNKGYNVRELTRKYDWKSEDCVYFGDALTPGGNDYTVVGVIPTLQVTDYKETFVILDALIKKYS